MISVEDCISLSGLTREEIDAIAEHEHIGEVSAAALADCLMHVPHGPEKVRDMIVDDIRNAMEGGNRDHARELLGALHHFVNAHQEVFAPES